jgi:hypothetical protein
MSEKRPTVVLTQEIPVEVPLLVNFINGKDVADYLDANLRTIGEAWTQALIEHARKRREARK